MATQNPDGIISLTFAEWLELCELLAIASNACSLDEPALAQRYVNAHLMLAHRNAKTIDAVAIKPPHAPYLVSIRYKDGTAACWDFFDDSNAAEHFRACANLPTMATLVLVANGQIVATHTAKDRDKSK